MARILMTWEFGSGYGHIARLRPVARELKRRGHEIVFALREVVRAESLASQDGMRIMQAPVYPDTVRGLPPAASFAEVLIHLGYLDANALTALVRSWRELVHLVEPRLIVGDASPTMLLATDGEEIARATLGDGYCCPPLQSPMPVLRWWQPGLSVLAGAEQEVLLNSNRARKNLHLSELSSVADFLRPDAEFLCTFAELDHYRDRNSGQYLGALVGEDHGIEPDWPPGKKRIFGYLRADAPRLDMLIDALTRSGQSVLMHVPGISPKGAAQYRARNLIVSPQPVHAGAALRDCDAVICHASGGMTNAALLAGKPLLLLPAHIEQLMIAKRVEALGAGIVIAPEEAKPDYRALLKRLFAEPNIGDNARAFAERYSSHAPGRVVTQIADRCEQLIEARA